MPHCLSNLHTRARSHTNTRAHTFGRLNGTCLSIYRRKTLSYIFMILRAVTIFLNFFQKLQIHEDVTMLITLRQFEWFKQIYRIYMNKAQVANILNPSCDRGKNDYKNWYMVMAITPLQAFQDIQRLLVWPPITIPKSFLTTYLLSNLPLLAW